MSTVATCTSAPTITIAPPTGSLSGVNAVLTLNTSGATDSVTIDTAGSGYTETPTATINVPAG